MLLPGNQGHYHPTKRVNYTGRSEKCKYKTCGYVILTNGDIWCGGGVTIDWMTVTQSETRLCQMIPFMTVRYACPTHRQ